MTTSAFGSHRLLARTLVVRGHRRADSAGEAFDTATFSSSPVASGHWSKRLSFRRSSSRLPGPAYGRARRAAGARARRSGAPSRWALVAGRRAGWTWLRAGVFAAVDGALGIPPRLLEKLVYRDTTPGHELRA